MHMYIFESSSYLYVSDCIWLYFAVHTYTYALLKGNACVCIFVMNTCTYAILKAVHIWLYFDCIWLYFAVHICMYLYVSDCILLSHTFTYASKLWFLLPQIGRPQQRDARESVKISNSCCRSRTSSTSASIVIPQQRVHHSVTYRIVLLQTQSCLHWMLCQCSVVLLRLVGLVVLIPLPGKLERMFFDCKRIYWEFSLNFSSVTLLRVLPIDCSIDREKSSYTNVLRNFIQ